jgi:hypothetical protein
MKDILFNTGGMMLKEHSMYHTLNVFKSQKLSLILCTEYLSPTMHHVKNFLMLRVHLNSHGAKMAFSMVSPSFLL